MLEQLASTMVDFDPRFEIMPFYEADGPRSYLGWGKSHQLGTGLGLTIGAKLAAPDEIVSVYGDLKDEAAIYSATIDNTDRAIGRLVAKLKETGRLDNTLIVYSSDNGSYRADRNGGLHGNKGSNFEGGLRSPGIFFWPDGFRGGRTESAPAGSVDLLPTICGLIGIDKPAGVHLDGADLSPLLMEKGTFKRAQPLIWLAPSSGHLATLRDGSYTLMGYRGYQLTFDRDEYNAILQEMAELAAIFSAIRPTSAARSPPSNRSPTICRFGAHTGVDRFESAWSGTPGSSPSSRSSTACSVACRLASAV